MGTVLRQVIAKKKCILNENRPNIYSKLDWNFMDLKLKSKAEVPKAVNFVNNGKTRSRKNETGLFKCLHMLNMQGLL